MLPAGTALASAPALVLGGELDVGAPTTALRKVAGLLPSGRFVRVRGAGALPALSDPAGCAARLARAFLQTRGHVSPGCASRPARPEVVRAFPLRLAAARPPARRERPRPRPLDAGPPAATAAALGVADALAGAGAAGDPTRVPGLRGGFAVVNRRGTTATLTLRGLRFVSDAALDGIVSNDSKTGSVYAAVTLRGSDGSLRSFVLTWNTNQIKGYAAARGSVDTRALLLVLPAP